MPAMQAPRVTPAHRPFGIVRPQRGAALVVLLAGLLSGVAHASPARESLRALEAHPFQGDVIRSAVAALQQDVQDRPADPWVYLGLAKANLVVGYRSGSRFDGSNFQGDAIKNARALVAHALELDSQLARAHAMRARVQILDGQYREAWETLNRAHDLDKRSFHAWYLLGVLNRFYEEYAQAERLLRRAKVLAAHDYQKRWVLSARLAIAEDTDDAVAEERLHKEVIRLFPERAHAYGNYGAFLLEQDRYEEAITSFEKALSITSYPLAERQLKKAKRLAGEDD